LRLRLPLAGGEGEEGQMKRDMAAIWTKREREVTTRLRECRCVSVFWLQEPLTRWSALNRMRDRGEVSITILGYPMYRVTIHKGKGKKA
jgi:hypothetical protein